MVRFFLNKRALLPLLAALASLWIAAPAWSQTTGRLRVTVVDAEAELPIPGALLVLSSPKLIGGEIERVTDGAGTHTFSELPPGSYRLVVTKGGAGSTHESIAIDVNRVRQLSVELDLASTEEIIVEAKRDAVDVESTVRGTVLTKEFLQNIPAGRSYQNMVTLTAGVQEGQGGNASIAGGAFNENTYMLDGVNITDPVTGTFSLNFNFDAIQQLEVLLGGYMPEYGTSSGGIVNVVTESGSNTLEFNTSVFYSNGNLRGRLDERLTADGFALAPTGFDNEFQTLRVASLIAGPIIRDKAWFIVSYQSTRSIIAATGSPQARDFSGHYVLAKVTVQPSTQHRLSMFLHSDPTNIANGVQGTPFIKAEAQEQQVQGGYVLSGRWQWFLSPEVSLETVAFSQKSYIEVNGVPCTHDQSRAWHQCRPGEAEGSVDWETPGRLGLFGAFDSVNFFRYYFDDRLRTSLSSKLSVLSVDDPLGGTHDLKFGVEASQLLWDQIQGITGNTFTFDLNAVAFDPQSFENYYWIETTGAIKFRTTSSQYNVFAQDSWKPVSNITLNYGARLDAFLLRNDLGEPVLSGALVGPRLFGSWDPFKDQKTKVATGYGRFNDTGRLAVSDFTSAGAYGQKLYLGEFFTDGAGQGSLNTQAQSYSLFPKDNLNVSHDNLRNPRVDEVILVLEREVVEDVAVYSSMSGKLTRFMFEFDDVNGIYDSDGSAQIGSRLADPINFYGRLRTPVLAKRDYFQWDLGVRKIESRRWFANATYTYTNAIGSSNQALSGAFANDPQTQFNYGQLNVNRRHAVTSTAYWHLPTDPWTQTLSMAFRYFDGFPIDRRYPSDGLGGTIRIRPRGTYYRFNPYWFLNLGFRQAIDVRKGQFILSLDAQNVFNNRSPDFQSTGFLNTQNRLLTVSRQDPLRLQFGLAYRF